MTDFEAQVVADLHVLKSQMKQIMGIGQPGRLHDLERRLAGTERSIQRMRGVVAAVATLFTIVQAAISYFASHR